MSLHPTMPAAEYHARPEWGSGDLRNMRKGPPARVQWGRQNREKSSDAMILGSACHMAILEPDLFGSVYVHKPEDMKFNTREGRDWQAAQPDGSIVLTHTQWLLVEAITKAVYSSPDAGRAIAHADGRETSVIAGPRKARVDFYGGGYVYDLKVSRNAEAGQWFAARAYGDGWLHQLAHYRTCLVESGVPTVTGRLVCVSPTAPHYVRNFEVKPDSLDLLALENETTVAALEACRLSGEWPGDPDGWTLIEPPAMSLADAALTDAEEPTDG